MPGFRPTYPDTPILIDLRFEEVLCCFQVEADVRIDSPHILSIDGGTSKAHALPIFRDPATQSLFVSRQAGFASPAGGAGASQRANHESDSIHRRIETV